MECEARDGFVVRFGRHTPQGTQRLHVPRFEKRMNRIDQPTLEPFPNIRTNPQFFRGRAEPKGCPKQGLDSTCSTLHLLIVPLPHGQVVVSLAAGKKRRGVLKRRLGETVDGRNPTPVDR